jgi:anti-sigma regulatory factor (Ser/Thr protein kinase)
VSASVKALCLLVPFSERYAHGIELCTTEAVVNSIKHAYGDEPDHEVTVTVTYAADRLIIDVCDSGRSMEPGMLERKRAFDTDFDLDAIDTIPESGRGLAIIQQVMDEVDYTIDGHEKCLRMVKKIPVA